MPAEPLRGHDVPPPPLVRRVPGGHGRRVPARRRRRPHPTRAGRRHRVRARSTSCCASAGSSTGPAGPPRTTRAPSCTTARPSASPRTCSRTEDYLFRYDTECHWLTATVPPLEWKPVRRAVGRWFLGSRNLITLVEPARAGARQGEAPARGGRATCSSPSRASATSGPGTSTRPTSGRSGSCRTGRQALYPWVGPSRARAVERRAVHRLRRLRGAQRRPARGPVGPARAGRLRARRHQDAHRPQPLRRGRGSGRSTTARRTRRRKKRLDPDGLFPELYEKLGRVG